jgi:hypothetical protein
VPLPNLAATADLDARGITWTSPEETRVATYLAEASAAIREAAGVPILQKTSTAVVTGSCDQWLRLPGPPVTAVSAVSIDGTALAADDYKLIDSQLWRSTGWQPEYEPSRVTVTLTHGLVEVPVDVVGMVCVLVAGALRASRATADGTGLAPPPGDVIAVAVDDFRVQFRQDGDRQVTLFELPDRVRTRLRARFGGGAHVLELR